MRGFGLMRFGWASLNNQPAKFADPHPVADHGRSSIESGNAGLDGFTVLGRSDLPVYPELDCSFEK